MQCMSLDLAVLLLAAEGEVNPSDEMLAVFAERLENGGMTPEQMRLHICEMAATLPVTSANDAPACVY